jgi:L-fuconolactonase
VIDTHVHFWKYAPDAHAWIGPHMRDLRRDFLPRDLEPSMRASGVEGCIAVQALHSDDETRWLLELADEHPWIVGVVGWVDLRAPDLVERLEQLSRHKKLVGIRHLAHDEDDERFLMRDDVVSGIGALSSFDLAFDLLVRERELPAVMELAKCLPNQTFVLDHLGKPPLRTGRIEGWAGLVSELAGCENVFAKLSGLVTESRGPPFDDVAPAIERALVAFGSDRLMAGSDWPVCLLASDYATSLGLARHHRLPDRGARARRLAYGV